LVKVIAILSSAPELNGNKNKHNPPYFGTITNFWIEENIYSQVRIMSRRKGSKATRGSVGIRRGDVYLRSSTLKINRLSPSNLKICHRLLCGMTSKNTALPRLSSLSTHLSSTATVMASSRPPITCHVLDTTVGLPAKDIPVTLSINAGDVSIAMTGLTNNDGRVTGWESASGSDLLSVFQRHLGDMLCTLRFETSSYWQGKGIKAFFPYVDIAFTTSGFNGIEADQTKPHWHVPLLLGPFNYTTYRGS
jgi:5-hydroxyisourate hydrolase